MSAGHDHGASHASERSLWAVLGLTTAFMLVEIVGGLLTGSLALISDAAHMFTDSAALAIALAAIRIGRRAPDHKRTFGYYRFEILAAAFNAVVLFLVAIYIFWEAYQRFRNPTEIQSIGMLVISGIGLAVNLIGMHLLRGGANASLNVKGAYLEVWADMIGSVAVIIAAIAIYFTHLAWIDSFAAAGIALWVVPRTWALLKDSLNILLEGVPAGLAIDEIEQAILEVSGVQAIHELHVWALTSGKNSLTVHIVVAPDAGEQKVLAAAAEMLAKRFGLTHTTIQVEHAVCRQEHANAVAEHSHPH